MRYAAADRPSVIENRPASAESASTSGICAPIRSHWYASLSPSRGIRSASVGVIDTVPATEPPPRDNSRTIWRYRPASRVATNGRDSSMSSNSTNPGTFWATRLPPSRTFVDGFVILPPLLRENRPSMTTPVVVDVKRTRKSDWREMRSMVQGPQATLTIWIRTYSAERVGQK